MKYLWLITWFLFGCGDSGTTSGESEDTDNSDSSDNSETDSGEITIDAEELVASIPAKDAKDCVNIEVPFDQCNNNDLIVFTGEVIFSNNQCNYSFKLETCNSACQIIPDTDDKCVMPCDSMVCNTPPNDKVLRDGIIVYTGNATCIDEIADLPIDRQNIFQGVEPTPEEAFCSYELEKTEYDCEWNEYIKYNSGLGDYECIPCPDGEEVFISDQDDISCQPIN